MIAAPKITTPQLRPQLVAEKMAYAHPYERVRFLCVDDNEINLRILVRVLQRLYPNCEIDLLVLSHTVAVSEQTLLHYDAIFLDIEMPLVTGVDLAREVRRLEGLNHVAVIAVTTKYLRGDVLFYEATGFDLTIPKPFLYGHSHMRTHINEAMVVRRTRKHYL